MRRRELLALSSVALAGCTTSRGPFESEPSLPLAVSVGSLQTEAVPEPVEYTVEAVEDRITREHTARIRVTVENTADDPVYIEGASNFPLHNTVGEGAPWGLVVAGTEPTRRAPDCLIPENPGEAFAQPVGVTGNGGGKFGPGDRDHAERTLWVSADDECLPRGETTFRTDTVAFRREDTPSEEATLFGWGFEVSVE